VAAGGPPPPRLFSRRQTTGTILSRPAEQRRGLRFLWQAGRGAQPAGAKGGMVATSLIMKHEVVELSVGFVGIGALLAVLALLLAQVWRPLP